MFQHFIRDLIRIRSRVFFVALIPLVKSSFEKYLLQFSLLVWFTYIDFCYSFCSNSKKVDRSLVVKIARRACPLIYCWCFYSLCTVPHWVQGCLLFWPLPFYSLYLFQAWFISVLQLSEVASFSQSSFLFCLTKLMNSALFFWHCMSSCSHLVFLNIL